MSRRKISVLTALVATSAMALSGCGGADESAGGGDTVKIMVFGSLSQPPFPLVQIQTAAEAAVDAVNADGGINGKQIEIIACDDQMNGNGATACGQQAVDEQVVAVVGAFTLFGDNIVPQLEAANIPYIGNVSISSQETSSPVSYGVMSAAVPGAAAIVDLADQGCKRLVQISNRNAESEASYDKYYAPVAESVGMESTAVLFPPSTTDFTSVAAEIAGAGDCALFGTGDQQTAAILTALDQMDADVTIAALSTIVLSEPTLEQLGSVGDGVQIVTPIYYPTTDEDAVTTAVDNILAKDSSTTIDETALNAYAAVLTFAEAAKGVEGDITGQSVIDALDSGMTIDTGMYAPTSFAGEGFFSPTPRVFDPIYQPYVSEDGKFVPNGDPIDLTEALAGL